MIRATYGTDICVYVYVYVYVCVCKCVWWVGIPVGSATSLEGCAHLGGPQLALAVVQRAHHTGVVPVLDHVVGAVAGCVGGGEGNGGGGCKDGWKKRYRMH